MWTWVNPSDDDRLHRFVELMQRMHAHYQSMMVPSIRSAMVRRNAELCLWEAKDQLLGMYFVPNHRSRHYLWSVGMKGDIGAAEALDKMVDAAFEYLDRNQRDVLFSIIPRTMSYPRIQELHRLALRHSRFKASVTSVFHDSLLCSLERQTVQPVGSDNKIYSFHEKE